MRFLLTLSELDDQTISLILFTVGIVFGTLIAMEKLSDDDDFDDWIDHDD